MHAPCTVRCGLIFDIAFLLRYLFRPVIFFFSYLLYLDTVGITYVQIHHAFFLLFFLYYPMCSLT